VRQCLIQRRAGFLLGDSKWSGRLVDVALLFHQPKLTKAVERIGWDDDQQAFVFPRFSISSVGDVKELGEPLPGDLLPARELEAPRIGLSPTDLDFDGASKSTVELFWAVAASILANILAKPFHREPVSIGLLGPGAVAVGEAIARAMGCVCHEVGGVADVRQCRKSAAAHDWPLLVRQTRPLRRSVRRQLLAEAGESRNVILAVDKCEVEPILADGWIAIVGQERGHLDDVGQELAVLLTPAYLKDLGDRRLAMKESSRRDQYFQCDVLDGLAAFVAGCFGNGEAVLAARQRYLAAQKAVRLPTAGQP
jgi:hypothetical protein